VSIGTQKSNSFGGTVLRVLVFGGTLCLPFSALGQATPQINPGGVVSSANYGPLIAPGGIFSIFGSGLATAPGGISSTPYPLNINGTQVTVNGEQAPLLYVSSAVINAQMPSGASGTVSVAVTVNGASSQPADVNIKPVAPAMYTKDGTGRHLIAAQHLNYSEVSTSAPAQPGEEIILYGTGLGATNPPLPTNTPPTAAAPAAETPVITIGGQSAQVLYAGAAGVYPGLYQINVYVPNVVAGNHEVIIRMPSENTQSSENAFITVGGPNQGTAIHPSYFGLHVSPNVLRGKVPWPSFDFGPMRLHGDAVTWGDLQPSPGPPDFTRLDTEVAAAVAHGKSDFIYTFVYTPVWAASNPNKCSPANPNNCLSPPTDLNPDGSGTDQDFINFVTAIAQRYAGEIPGKISNWEIWNEPNAPNYWTGTQAQLVRMEQDARTIIKGIDPQAVILTPAPAGGGVPPADAPSDVPVGGVWMSSFLTQSCMPCGGGTGASDADVIAFHGYVNLAMQPHGEDIQQGLATFQSDESADGVTKPLWDSEAGWGKDAKLSDPDLQAAFAARMLLAQQGVVQRFYWYHYDYPEGTLFDTSTNTLTKAGVAYGQVFDWTTGAAITQACAFQGGSSVWTCPFVRQNGFQAMAVWDSNQSCSNGNCTTSNFTPPSNMIKYRDLSGNTVSITPGSAVAIGAKPIWLTNQ